MSARRNGDKFIILPGGTSVAGPSSGGSTDNAIPRWDGTGGRTLQNSTAILADDGGIALTGPSSGTWNGLSVTQATAGQPQIAIISNGGQAQFICDFAGNMRLRNTSAAKAITFEQNAETGRFAPTSGNLLLGTTTDSSNGKLQLATHTTSAGGIAWGTEWSLFRSGALTMELNTTGAQNILYFQTAGTRRASTGTDGTNMFVSSSGGSVILQANGATGLTLDTSLFVAKSTGSNGQSLNIKHLTELTTIAAAATTDTTIQMPAGAIVLSVSVRVTVVIPTAATFTVGDSGTADRFSTAAVSTAANSTNVGTKAGAYYNASALSIRITPNVSPADNTGRVRVTIAYLDVTVPTS